jgi:hypothetical protein
MADGGCQQTVKWEMSVEKESAMKRYAVAAILAVLFVLSGCNGKDGRSESKTIRGIPIRLDHGNVMTEMDVEAVNQVMNFLLPTKIGDSYYLKEVRQDVGDKDPSVRIVEMKEPTVTVEGSGPNQADTLNGLEYKGSVWLHAKLLRDYQKPRGWSEWKESTDQSASGALRQVPITKQNGKWKMDTSFPYPLLFLGTSYKEVIPSDIPK